MTTLQNIFGQDTAIKTILCAYDADRLPHGLIFAGPVGVGKGTTARALATTFLCAKPNGSQACGKCDSCVLMEVGNHPDYHVVHRLLIRLDKQTAKATVLAVDVIRDYLVTPANHTASMNRGKVFIVEEAELMMDPAQNALLKTLEEPAGRSLIILLTDQPNVLLPTIRSRCQIVRFGVLDPKIVRHELEALGIDSKLAAEAAELAEGSLGAAMKWVEDGIVEASRDLLKMIDALVTGRSAGDLADWFKKSADAYADCQLKRDKYASKDQATREGLGLYLKIAATRFRQKLSGTSNADFLEHACRGIEAIQRAESYLDSNVNVGLALQHLSASLER